MFKLTKNQEPILNDSQDELPEKEQLILIKEILENTQSSIKKALLLLEDNDVDTQALLDSLKDTRAALSGNSSDDNGSPERIVEGVFNGDVMIAGDGSEYSIPANYASKSKLVEGDILKLSISKDGSFIYKQIGPVERKQLIADLAFDDITGDWYAVSDNERWKLLTASITYFKGKKGDEVVIVIPRDGNSKWAAVENMIKH